MGTKARLGWALIALAGAVSIGIVTFEVWALAGGVGVESSETLPVIGFVPPSDN